MKTYPRFEDFGKKKSGVREKGKRAKQRRALLKGVRSRYQLPGREKAHTKHMWDHLVGRLRTREASGSRIFHLHLAQHHSGQEAKERQKIKAHLGGLARNIGVTSMRLSF